MTAMDRFMLWIWFISVQLASMASAVDKNLMLLQSGMSSQFDSTWLLNSNNDPHNNKSDELYLAALLTGGEFKASIDPDWGDPEWVKLSFLNSIGDTIGQTQFYTPNTNITTQTAWMSTTFDLIMPFNMAWDSAGCTVRDGDKEVLVRELTTQNIYQTIFHPAGGSVFIIAVNSTQPFVSGSVTQNSLGCKPTTVLQTQSMGPSDNDMTVENCFMMCETSGYLYIGIKSGTDCYCVNIALSELYSDLPQYCTLPCSGNGNQTCGGINSSYMSVYNVTGQSDQLDNLTTVQTKILLSESQTSFTYETTITVQSGVNWSEDYMYVTGIKVVGQNSSGHNVKYTVKHRYDHGDTFFTNFTSALGDSAWIGVTGVTYDIETLLITELKVQFLENTGDINVSLIGPYGSETNPAYVTAEYVLVTGTFTPTSTSTATPTSLSTSTTTTSNPSSATNNPSSTTNNPSSTTNNPSATTSNPSSNPSTTTATPSVTSASPSTTSTAPVTASPPSTITSSVPPISSTTASATTPAPVTTSLSTSTVVYTNLSIIINGQLYCPCTVSNSTTNTTTDIAAIIAELTLDKSTLSSNKRRYTSAEDNRPSAKTLGALGVIIISVVIGCIVMMDSANLKSEAVKIKKNYRYLKKQLSKRSLKVDDISTISQNDPKVNSLPDVLM